MTLAWDRMKTRNTCTRAHLLGSSGSRQTSDLSSCHPWTWKLCPRNNPTWAAVIYERDSQYIYFSTMSSSGFLHPFATCSSEFVCQVATSVKSNPPPPPPLQPSTEHILPVSSITALCFMSLFNILPAHLFHLAGQYPGIFCGLRFELKYL
jgi:hypothetical protein